MSIQEHLNKIRNAVYGHEVRESIAKGIETAYDDASENGNANMEVKMARGTNPNLNARLNKMEETDQQTNARLAQIDQQTNARLNKMEETDQQTTAQLAEKANKDEVTNVMTPKGTLAYASLPKTGNSVGWYYYCPDGDGTHGAGNYVWNGTSWYFGGTGDEGYNLLKKDLVNIDELLEREVIKPYSQNGSATISTSWGYVHVVDNIELPTVKMYRFTFTIPSATTNVIYCRARKGTTTFLQLQIAPGNTRVSLDKYCETLDIDYLDATGDINAVGLTVSATIEEIGGETIEKSIFDKVEMNPLYGKTVLFNGDSICASATDTEHNLAWAGRITNRNSMNGKNYAVMGGTISSNNYRKDSSAYHWISASVDTMYSENPNADYIIFEGGTNDADLLGSIINGNTSERLGTFSLGDFSGNYDMNTFCGAFENLCHKATNYWAGKKIGYVVAYKMAGKSGLSSGYTKEKSNRRAYFDIAMQICEKWGIPVLNLWDNCHMNPSNVACYDPSLSETENKATKMIYDGQHPATKGYEYIYPIIESWMKTL